MSLRKNNDKKRRFRRVKCIVLAAENGIKLMLICYVTMTHKVTVEAWLTNFSFNAFVPR